ncbi:hypothetical protein OsJ_36133 [Oryza sativa Japonica Group]|uniref:Uncharacterized protein n=1 Tax=Oryza sativa subsp. japonica TaxID=39947 RepID=B9GD76_ORYSJ|nr:hypothetical protein OsJ_36133 [Oryza sativa Japonica Group]
MSWGAAARGIQTATGFVTSVNTWAEFFNCLSSAISSACSWINIHQKPQNDFVKEEIQHLQSDLWQLQTTLPKMRNLVEILEWQIYKKPAAELLPHIKDALLDAEDIIDEFNYYELKAKIEGRIEECLTSSGCQEFYMSVIRGSFNRVKEIQEKLDHLHRQSMDLGLHCAAQRFDKIVRPETSSFLNSQIFGRQEEEKMVLELLGVQLQANAGYKRKRSSRVEVLPIVGLGGVGKTTLAQQICKNQMVKAHFDMILWACVSDDFNAKRLTKEVIQSSKKETSFDNLDSLQSILKDTVELKRFLLVLDDIWDDVMADGGQDWQRFCAPLSNALQGSMILITTRSQKVADKSELWKLEQDRTDILPALRLSYMYLPPHLKRCFSFCAVYPKDYRFEKDTLVDIWLAEGFVEHASSFPTVTVVQQYFEELLSRSFFQKVTHGKYVIHDLMHDMAQLVSQDECFIIRNANDLRTIPSNVRHLSIFTKRYIGCHDLMGLCRSLPCDFGNLISLRKFRAKNFSYLPGEDSRMQFLRGERIKVLKYVNQVQGSLLVNLPGLKSKKNIGLTVLKKENNLYSLHISQFAEDARYEQEQLEVCENLHPHPDLQHLEVTGYQGENFCPSWFLPDNLPNMISLIFEECHNAKKISLHRLPCTGFQYLINLYIIECTNLSSIEQFLQPCHIPAIKMISIKGCQELSLISAERFGGFRFLEALVIRDCPRISWENGLALPPTLTSLSLVRCGDISKWIPDCLLNLSSLVRLQLVGLSGTMFIPGSIWRNNLPLLDYLEICNFQELRFTGVPEAIEEINNVLIDKCPMLKELKQPFSRGDVTFLWGIPTSKWYLS